MPSRNQSGKPEHSHQNPHRKTQRSGKKYPKLINHWMLLLKKEKREGLTKWIVNAKAKASARMKTYGLSPTQVEQIIANKETAKAAK